MSGTELTPLEKDLLERFHQRYSELGFPQPIDVCVSDRNNTGAGRYTYFDHPGVLCAPDGRLGLGKYGQLDMVGLTAGASFWVYVKGRKLSYLEIAVNGDEEWDGTEKEWTVSDPDTGEFSS